MLKLSAFVSGFLFAMGLVISGMAQPHLVLAFLDLFGAWDPRLIFVMLGAIGVHLLSYRWIKNRRSPLFDVSWHVPSKKELSIDLFLGAAAFGVGWGMVGLCPGPVIVNLAQPDLPLLLFFVALLVGVFSGRWIRARVFERK